jgi:hypothetical protein
MNEASICTKSYNNTTNSYKSQKTKIFRSAMFVCVIHEKPKAKSVERPGGNTYSEIPTKIVEIPNVPIG